MDKSLTEIEKKWLLDKAGRYLLIDTGETGGDIKARFIRKTGAIKPAGEWTIKVITKPNP